MDALPIHEANEVPIGQYMTVACMRAATTDTRPCCWAQRAMLLRLATSLVMWPSLVCGVHPRDSLGAHNRCGKPDFLRYIFETVIAALHAGMDGRSCSTNYSISHQLSHAATRLRMQSLAPTFPKKDIHHRYLSALPGLPSLWRRQSILMQDASLPGSLK
jgi:hypothetical protein